MQDWREEPLVSIISAAPAPSADSEMLRRQQRQVQQHTEHYSRDPARHRHSLQLLAVAARTGNVDVDNRV